MAQPRPQVKPALRRVWRDGSTLQLGVDPAHAVVIGGLDPAAARVVESLDGTRDLSAVTARAARLGVDSARLDELLGLLERSGVLEDAADHRALGGLSRDERDRLAPDLAAASLLPSGTQSGVATLVRRRRAVVQVCGAGRVGAAVVSLLAAAGVGALVVEDAGCTQPADVSPAGATLADVGGRRQEVALRAARRVAPSVRSTLPARRAGPDLAVLAGPGPDLTLTDRFLRSGVPHLLARVRETTGVVGPLVLPGRSSCQRCHDLHRSDRDPAWPSIAAQLADGAARAPGMPCDAVLATAVAAHAALQVLAYLGGDPAPPSVDGTLEIAQADGRVRRRSWSRHPSCGCSWGAVVDDLPG